MPPTQVLQVLLRLGLMRTCAGVLGDISRALTRDRSQGWQLLTDYRAGHRALAAARSMVRVHTLDLRQD